MNQLTELADKAARENDRWLMVALLLVLLTIGFGLWRWMISDREKIANRLIAMTDRHIAATEKLSEVVANNTAVLHDVKRKL